MLNEQQKDALKEVGSIGAGHAATALSQLVDKKVLVTVPRLEIIPIEQMTQFMGDPENLVTALKTNILGDISGKILFILERENALFVADMLKGTELGSTKTFNEIDEKMLTQAGNILVMAYLNALTRLTGLAILSSQPDFVFDMMGAILSTVCTEDGINIEQAVIIDADFVEESNKVKGRLIFMPVQDSLKAILDAIKI